MKQLLYLLFLIIFGLGYVSHSQSANRLKEINQIWAKFYTAFDSLDYTQMAEIHSMDLLRISGGTRILDYDTYIANYKSSFERLKRSGERRKIHLRFFERINSDTVASERGIYKLLVTDNSGRSTAYYGQFHVIMKKRNGHWLITMDYDSNEENSINEERFQEAKALNDLEYFSSNDR